MLPSLAISIGHGLDLLGRELAHHLAGFVLRQAHQQHGGFANS